MESESCSSSDLFRWTLASGTTQQAATPLNHVHNALSLTAEGQPAYGSHMWKWS